MATVRAVRSELLDRTVGLGPWLWTGLSVLVRRGPNRGSIFGPKPIVNGEPVIAGNYNVKCFVEQVGRLMA